MFIIFWSRWGLLGIGIPFLLVVAFGFGCEAAVGLLAERPNARQTTVADVVDQAAITKRIEELKAAKRAEEEDSARTARRAYRIGAISGLLASGVLWPLGRWLNRTERRMLLDPQSGQMVEYITGGGHILYFIPLQYWSIPWVVIGFIRMGLQVTGID